MALPTLILLSIEMAVGMPMLLLLEGWGTLDFNKFGCFFVSIFLVPRMVSENSPPRCGRVHENLSLKKQLKNRNVSQLLSRGTSMQLVYSFLGIFSVLVAALLDAWCHWSLQRDRTTPAEEIPGQCFGFWVKLRWTWWSPICCYTFFYSSFHSFTKFHKWVLSLKTRCCRVFTQDTAACGEKSRVFQVQVLSPAACGSGDSKTHFWLDSEGDSFVEVMSMCSGQFLFFHIFGLHEFSLFSLVFTFGIPRFIKPI